LKSDLCNIVFPEGQQEGTKSVIGRWLKAVGDNVKQYEPVVEISTDKVTMEVSATVSGVLREITKQEGAETGPGDILGSIEKGVVQAISKSTGDGATSASRSNGATRRTEAESGGEQRLSPAVRKLLADYGISADQIKGSGRDGRITHDDVRSFLAARDSAAVTSGASIVSGALSSRRVPHTPMRRTIAKHMVESLLHTAPHVTSVFECDMGAVIAHREANKNTFEERGTKLTFTAYFVKAAAAALKAVPEVNSRFHEDALEIFESCNVGVATALEKDGLVVPVIRNAEMLDLFGVASSLQDLTTRARAGKLTTADLQGGTFTITNHGTSGSLIATPIISQPQSAILGIGKLERRPVVVSRNGLESIEPRSRVYITLTIDHRALDGFVANLFLSKFTEFLEGWTG
jgi:2-oxoglutarate dehydrogenase E2 component (dihydrolipoamide succinyltransferase)